MKHKMEWNQMDGKDMQIGKIKILLLLSFSRVDHEIVASFFELKFISLKTLSL